MLRKVLHTIDRSFDAGNRENFILNEGLLVFSLLLLFVAGLEILHSLNYIFVPEDTRLVLHAIEFVFGIIFLIEFFLRTIYVYIPDNKFFTLYPWVTLLVIASLLFPSSFNLAFLRIIYVIKMFKIYHLRRESHHIIAEHPEVADPVRKKKAEV